MDNCWLVLALDSAGSIGAMLDQDVDAMAARSATIRAGFDRNFWRGDHYASPDHAGPPDERGNALALKAVLCDEVKWPAIRAVLNGPPQASIYMEKFVISALLQMECAADAIARIKKRYGPEIESDYSTLPESFGERSNHGWGGWPLTMLGRYIAGIEPVSPGGKKFLVRPNLGGLSRLHIVVPSSAGRIALDVTSEEKLYLIDLEVPAGASAALKIRSDVFVPWARPIDHVEINGHPVNRSLGEWLPFPLEAGRWRVAAR